MTRTLTDLIVEATQVLKHKDAERYADVIRFMLAKDKQESHKPRKNKAKRVELQTRAGGKVRGGTAYVNMANEQIQYEERER